MRPPLVKHIPTAWLENEPIRSVPLYACSGEQLELAMFYANPEEYRALKKLWRVFTERGGRSEDTFGDIVKLPTLVPSKVTKVANYIPNDNDWADRRYASRRSLI